MKVRAKVSLGSVVEGEVYEVIEKITDQKIVVDDKCGDRYVMFDDGEYEVVEEEQSKEWNGGGLPPIGTVCEMLSPILGMWAEQWLKVEIISIKGDYSIGWCSDKGIAIWNVVTGIRPIKSEKEKEIEKFDDAIDEWDQGTNKFVESLAEYLYKKGFRFKGE